MPEGSPWRRGAVEAVFVLTSILLAFAIDAWWEERQDEQTEAAILSAVAEEAAINRADLQGVLERTEARLDRIDEFMRASPAELGSVPPDSMFQWAFALPNAPEYDPLRGAASLLTQTPLVGSDGIGAREAVNQWFSALASAEVTRNTLQLRRDALQERLAEYAERGADGGFTDLTRMVVRSNPAILQELRSDHELVAMVIRKAHTQWAYANLLRDVMESLDAVASAASPGTSAP